MNSKEFKVRFSESSRANGFDKAFGGWFKESSECIVVLDLQKSNFSDRYDLNIKIFVQGMFGNQYKQNKDLVKREIGNVFIREPKEYEDVFDFNLPFEDSKRIERLNDFFTEFLIPFTRLALSKSGIMSLAEKGKISLSPAVREELII